MNAVREYEQAWPYSTWKVGMEKSMFVQYYAHPTNIRMGRSDQIIMKLIEVEDTSVTVGLQASGQGKVNYAALIAVGAVALIGVIVTLICCCRKKKYK